MQLLHCHLSQLPSWSTKCEIGHLDLVSSDECSLQCVLSFVSPQDGYAMHSADGVGVFPVVSESTAGGAADASFVLQRGQVAYITTGAAVPAGADAVIPVEWSEAVAHGAEEAHVVRVKLTQSVSAGDNIRPIGCDIAVGQTVLRAGELVGPAEIGMAASMGFTSLHVIDRPTVGVMSSGDEVVDAGSSSSGGAEPAPSMSQIYDSNRPLLLSLAQSAGAKVVDFGIVRDDPAVLEERVRHAFSTVDILVLSGGVSMGAKDYVKPLLARLGTIHFGRLNMKPGKPTTFATVRLPGSQVDKLVFGLPGNPVSALVTGQLLLVPAIRILRGSQSTPSLTTLGYPSLPVRLDTPLERDAQRPEYHRVSVRFDANREEYRARSSGNQRSSRLVSACASNGLIEVPAGKTAIPAGEIVRVLMVGAWESVAAGQNDPPPLPIRPGELAAAAAGAALNASTAAVSSSSSQPQAPSAAAASSASPAASSAPAPSVFELRVGVLTVSDRCSRGQAVDLSGPAIVKLLQSTQLKNTRVTIFAHRVVSDDVPAIQAQIKQWTDAAADSDNFAHLILTTGGTGFSPRDVTPEAVTPLLERPSSGLVFAMMQASMAATPMGALSRPVAGARARSLILTLPGSPKAIPEILTPILPILPHAVKLLQSTDDPHSTPSAAAAAKAS
jgi:gephyrin